MFGSSTRRSPWRSSRRSTTASRRGRRACSPATRAGGRATGSPIRSIGGSAPGRCSGRSGRTTVANRRRTRCTAATASGRRSSRAARSSRAKRSGHAAGVARDLALPLRRRPRQDRQDVAPAAGPSALPLGHRAAAAARVDGRRVVGAAARPAGGAGGALVRGRRRARVLRARRRSARGTRARGRCAPREGEARRAGRRGRTSGSRRVDLGSVYLGGWDFTALQRAGRVEELTPGRRRARGRAVPHRGAAVVP